MRNSHRKLHIDASVPTSSIQIQSMHPDPKKSIPVDPIVLGLHPITLQNVYQVAFERIPVTLSPNAKDRVLRGRALVEKRAASEEAAYGINTGFGSLAHVKIPTADRNQLQLNLLRSHAAGVGAPLDQNTTRALMFLRAIVLASGRSGVRLVTLERLLYFLNEGLHPVIPCRGSVGASGDLAPLAHLGLTLVGEGEIWEGDSKIPASEALAKHNLSPLVLGPKEGLCLVNGTQAMGAIASLCALRIRHLCDVADAAGAMSLEAARGSHTPFQTLVHSVRPHPGQIQSATFIRRLLEHSEIQKSHIDCDKVQDAYSFRCIPQVHGATRDTLEYACNVIETEINSATDNPLVFAEEGEGDQVVSAGNFHGQPLALVLDFLAIATSELANISDRRVEQLIDPALSGLPAFLTPSPGLNSGFMMAQVTSAALVNENKILSHPASTDSIPTSANREDHVSMGMTAALKLCQILDNVEVCLAIELLVGAQAIDFVKLTPGRGVTNIHSSIRERVPFMGQDRILSHDIQAIVSWIRDRILTTCLVSISNIL